MTHDASALIAAHLLSSLGMNASVLEAAHLRRAIRRRMEASGLRSLEGYAEHYRTSPREQELLAEEMYIHETCFFRDRAVFTEMLSWVTMWLATHDGPMAILSAPCSTGEEPYSIAATLLEAGVAADRIRIHAVDISANALAKAEQGRYSGMSLRNVPEPQKEMFLESAGSGWRVTHEVRGVVDFERVNLLDTDALPDAAYDLVFCRNLLIYLDPTARLRVAKTLMRTLKPQGRLVLGAADWSSDLATLFRMDGPANAFAFRPIPAPRPQENLRIEALPSVSSAPEIDDESAGDLEDAQRLYQTALAISVQDAAAAERLCRQALYLQNDHLPALELLSRLWRSRASHRMNRALAARLRRRRIAVEGVA